MTVIRGRTTTLVAQWFEYPGGPVANVTGVTITITPAAGGPAVLGPTAVGVANPVTGTNTYQWAVPIATTPGDYLVVWNGVDPESDAVQASEIITVLAGAGTSTSGPCEIWEPTWCCDLLEVATVTGAALEAATEVLYALSGRRFGGCSLELWPCRRSCYGEAWPASGTWWELGGTYPQPALIQGAWFNLTCGECLDGCTCTPLSRVRLPTPIIEVTEVVVDGVTLTADVDYRLDNGRFLTRLGGESWPICNDLTQTSGDGTWSVTLTYGEPVPTLGSMAVGELACELAKACVGADCRLPKPVQQLVRQGVTMSFLDPNEVFANGGVGLYFADLFITTYNPQRRNRRARVYDVDNPDFPRLGS